MNKISIGFFDDKEVRAVWDDEKSKWWFSVLDIIGVLRGSDDYEKNRNYWKFLKSKLKKENSQLVSVANQLKLTLISDICRICKNIICIYDTCRKCNDI